jgi:hypothetical protein
MLLSLSFFPGAFENMWVCWSSMSKRLQPKCGEKSFGASFEERVLEKNNYLSTLQDWSAAQEL